MSKEKIIILLTVFIDVIGLGIIIPVMPSYVLSFGTNPSTVTILFSVFAFFSFLSAPFLGTLSDKIGRRPILMISILSSSIGWLIFAWAPSIIFLFIGRIIDGLAAGNFSTAQSAISDLSKDPKERTANLGLVGAMFGVGFIIGPLIGGLLSTISHSFPFIFVGMLAFINFLAAYFFLPETNNHIDKNIKIHWNPIKLVVTAFIDKKLRKLYITWFIFNAIAMGSNAIFALYLLKQFGLGSFGSGLFYTGVGLIIAFNQGFALKRLWLKYFNEKKLILIMFGVFIIGFAVMAYPLMWLYIVGTIFTSFGQSILRVVISSEVIGETPVEKRGEANGILFSVASIASIIGPLIIGFLFEYSRLLPYAAASLFSLIALIYISGRKFPKIETVVAQ